MISFDVNGTSVAIDDRHGARRLLDVLREDLGYKGTKEGCGEGECGACSVTIDGQVVNSCLIAVGQVAGSSILTVEGLETGTGELSPLQQAFVEHGGAQCGICTPGMLLAAHALLQENPAPSYEEVQVALAGNLCRCTGYTKIIESVLACRPRPS
ncbi:MAG: (2Fe-2S)-binding protein [Gemmatimonadales bacterium]